MRYVILDFFLYLQDKLTLKFIIIVCYWK